MNITLLFSSMDENERRIMHGLLDRELEAKRIIRANMVFLHDWLDENESQLSRRVYFALRQTDIWSEHSITIGDIQDRNNFLKLRNIGPMAWDEFNRILNKKS